ncbi:MAG TPA: DUF802 domain-containing protein [Rhodocyclaceae bacterium]|nr:DUF802 domain-containing protein [Rhodocyclaceae bacterium]
MNRNLCVAAFAVGLLTVVWVAAGYGAHPLALTMTSLIGAVYIMGGREMLRFHRDSRQLVSALHTIPEGLTHLGEWIAQVPTSLQSVVRLRVEGERVAMPGPALTPYLIGLLVMLGMLGTFLGMVVTLSGVGITLENTTDLQTIRSSLSAPIKGLGLAFGTSVAGVSASAMLGLISALCRRERQDITQLLDAKIASALRDFSVVHQRQETFKALQFQAQAMPEVVGKLHELMTTLERQNQQMNERMLANQESFYREVKGVYTGLAVDVDKSLKTSLSESARVASETIKPIVEATLGGIARESESLQARMADTVKTQLDGLSERFASTAQSVEANWNAAIANQERSNAQLNDNLGKSLNAFAENFDQRSASLLDKWSATLDQQASGNEQLNANLDKSLSAFAASFEQRSAALADNWSAALANHERTSQQMSEALRQSLAAFAETFEQRSASLIANVQAESATRDEQRLASLSQSLEAMAASLQREWQQAGAQSLEQQQKICATLEQTARDITAQAQTHASETIGEITKLMQTAAEAPRAAAEVIGQLRQEISSSIARDNALLEERGRIMETLSALLDAINHASAEQRAAIDSLVASSADVLQKVSAQFTEQIGAESTKMADVAIQMTGSAVEVSSLAESLSFAVQQFSDANGKMIENLQRIEGSLDKSLTRSDEQLAYYVAQAREIIDLSIMSQKQVVEDMQKLTGKVN